MKAKYIVIVVILFLRSTSGFSQLAKFTGSWFGTLNVGIDLRIVFHITQNENGILTVTADSPDQAAFGLKCDTTFISNDTITIEMKNMQASFTGKLTNDSVITGKFVQKAGIPLTLIKKKDPASLIKKRPQTPQAPFTYKSEDITYINKDGSINFGATVTIPEGKGPFPAVVLVSGSGPQNRNAEMLGPQFFAVLADHLSKNGIVVLRYDERGIGKSTGIFGEATTADFAEDASAGVDYLLSREEVDKKKIGMIGHSEGGIVVPMVATIRKDIDFLVLLAAPGISILDLMAEQNEAIAMKNGVSAESAKEFGMLYRRVITSIIEAPDSIIALQNTAMLIEKWAVQKSKQLLTELNLAPAKNRFDYVSALTSQVRSKWFKYFLSINPAMYLQQLKCKVLALNGDKDIQVISTSNLAGISNALKKSKSKKYEVKEIPGLNHLFQHCTSCTANE
ncbi:MAG: alpha/beta hydrolase [Chitinophagaceae bacterium]